jgi:hypothetical protein
MLDGELFFKLFLKIDPKHNNFVMKLEVNDIPAW